MTHILCLFLGHKWLYNIENILFIKRQCSRFKITPKEMKAMQDKLKNENGIID